MTIYFIADVGDMDFLALCKYFDVDPDSIIGIDDLMKIVHERNGTDYTGHVVVSYNPDRDPNYEVYWF